MKKAIKAMRIMTITGGMPASKSETSDINSPMYFLTRLTKNDSLSVNNLVNFSVPSAIGIFGIKFNKSLSIFHIHLSIFLQRGNHSTTDNNAYHFLIFYYSDR